MEESCREGVRESEEEVCYNFIVKRLKFLTGEKLFYT